MGRLVFLGGTVGKNDWRDGFIARIVSRGVPGTTIFNPVVADWNEEARRQEEEAKRHASHHIYYLADPKQEGNPLSAYSMVEAAIALHESPKNTVVVFDTEGMSGHALKAMKQTENVLRTRFPKAAIFSSTKDAEDWLVRQLTRSFFGRMIAA